jgi:hypothetical protein
MKKILLSSAVLLALSVSIIIFQISCQKIVVAQSPAPAQAINKVLLQTGTQKQVGTIDSSGFSFPVYRYVIDFYLVQYDGTNLTKINIAMPAGEYPVGNGVLSPDGEKIIFSAAKKMDASWSVYSYSVYSYSLNGSALVKLADGSYQVQGAY